MIYHVGKFIRQLREGDPVWTYTLLLDDRFHNFKSPEELARYLREGGQTSIQLADIGNTERISPKIQALDLSEKKVIYQLDMSE